MIKTIYFHISINLYLCFKERWHKFNKMEQIKIKACTSVLFSFTVTYNLSLDVDYLQLLSS